MRPQLTTCTPTHVVAFLEHWRQTHRGRVLTGSPQDHAHVTPTTLRQTCSHLSAILQQHGRSGEWAPAHPQGNPCASFQVRDYLTGYHNYCFQELSYSTAGAVPLSLELYLALQKHLLAEADKCPQGYFQLSLYYRDLTAFAYCWETAQRGKECGHLLITDIFYQNLQCQPIWPDVCQDSLLTDTPIAVESSLGTKTRSTGHPGVLQLEPQPRPDGTGWFIAYLPL